MIAIHMFHKFFQRIATAVFHIRNFVNRLTRVIMELYYFLLFCFVGYVSSTGAGDKCPYAYKCKGDYGYCTSEYYGKYEPCVCECYEGYYGKCCEYAYEKRPGHSKATGPTGPRSGPGDKCPDKELCLKYGYCKVPTGYYGKYHGDSYCYCECYEGYYGKCCEYAYEKEPGRSKATGATGPRSGPDDKCPNKELCSKYGYCKEGYYDKYYGESYCKCECNEGYYGKCCEYAYEKGTETGSESRPGSGSRDKCPDEKLCSKNGHCKYYGDSHCECDCNIGYFGTCCEKKVRRDDCDKTPQCLCCVDDIDVLCDCTTDFSKGVDFKKCGKRTAFTSVSCGPQKQPTIIAFDGISKEICAAVIPDRKRPGPKSPRRRPGQSKW